MNLNPSHVKMLICNEVYTKPKILRLDLMGSQPSFSKTNMTTLERVEFFGYNGVGLILKIQNIFSCICSGLKYRICARLFCASIGSTG